MLALSLAHMQCGSAYLIVLNTASSLGQVLPSAFMSVTSVPDNFDNFIYFFSLFQSYFLKGLEYTVTGMNSW